jgi:uncharacterized protein with PQ loop repeat
MQYDWVGYIAGFFFIICYFPQIYTLWHGQTGQLNIYMIILQLLGAIGMTIYAILNSLIPIIVLNTTSVLCLAIIAYCALAKKN